MTRPLNSKNKYIKNHNELLDTIKLDKSKTGTDKPYKFITYCIYCNKRFFARICSIKVCDSCSVRQVKREMRQVISNESQKPNKKN